MRNLIWLIFGVANAMLDRCLENNICDEILQKIIIIHVMSVVVQLIMWKLAITGMLFYYELHYGKTNPKVIYINYSSVQSDIENSIDS